MTNYAKVKEQKGLVREMYSKAILNTDAQALQEHRKNKKMMKELVDNSTKIKKIEDDISSIKEMLSSIVNSKVS